MTKRNKKQRLDSPPTPKKEDAWYCPHPYTSLTLVWKNVYHCWDCGLLIGEDDDIEED